MSYRTIIVHVDASRHAPQRIRIAARLAAGHDAHLVGVAATGISRAVFPHGYRARSGTLEASCFDPLHEAAERALAQFADLCGETGVAFEQRLVCDLDSEALARQGRFADLLVVSQDDPDEALTETVGRIPEYVAFTCARPVLVTPCAPVTHGPGRHVLVAWNGSKEASAALRAALPLMRNAVRASVVAFRPPGDADLGDTRHQADLAAFLARHDVQAGFVAVDSDVDGGRALLALAQQDACDLLVMGGYGHSRFRELVLGGVTRTVLRGATMCVLVAH